MPDYYEFYGDSTVTPIRYTDWASGAPPSAGWWNTCLEGNELVSNGHERRWWNGSAWSLPVFVNGDYTDQEVLEIAQCDPRSIYQDRIRFRGLVSPHPEGYSYEILSTGHIQAVLQVNKTTETQLGLFSSAPTRKQVEA